MTDENKLITYFQGVGYEEEVTLFYHKAETGETIVVFKELSYQLVDSSERELQLDLNFGGQDFMPHAIKNINGRVALVPRFYSLDSGRYPGRKMYMGIKSYLSLPIHSLLIFPKIDFVRLWDQLKYEASELDQIGEVSQADLVLMWLISSGYQCAEHYLPFVDNYAQKVLRSVIAEESPTELSIKEIIPKIVGRNFVFSLTNLLGLYGEQFHIVYLLNEDDSISEWKSLAVVNSNMYMVLGELLIGITLL